MTNWRGGSDMGIEAISIGRWDVHVSRLGDNYWWCVSGAFGILGTGLSESPEQAKIDALDKLIGTIDAWRSDAIRVRQGLGGAAAKGIA